MPLKEIEKDAIEELSNYNWTGNIRELNNVIARLIILSSKVITKKDVKAFVTQS
jgi:transcriptional regulator with PAS, ATPase and Fis domain